MWHLEAEKEQKLSVTLQSWHDGAKLKQVQYSAQLTSLQQRAADLAEDMADDAVMSATLPDDSLLPPVVRICSWEEIATG